jgi:HK97 family phage portal protein
MASLLSIFKPKTQQRSSLSAPTDWLTQSLSSLFGSQTTSGMAVNSTSAMSIASVHACVRVISDAISGLSFKLYFDDGTNKRQVVAHYSNYVLNEPNPYQTKFDFMTFMTAQLVLKGNAYAFIKRDERFIATAIHPIVSDTVSAYMMDGELFYRVNAPGFPSVIPASDMLHFKGLSTDNVLVGKSPIIMHAETLGIDLAAIKSSAAVYKNGTLKFLLKSVSKIDQAQAAPLRKSLDDVIEGNQRSAVLPHGVEMEKLSMTPEEAQYIQARQFSAEEIARIFGVPASMIGAKDGIKSSVEQEYQDFYSRTLMSYCINIEQELRRKLLTENDKTFFYFKFNFNSLLRASANDRADFYNKGIRGGWLSPNEARAFEDAEGFDNGGKYYVEANLIPADQFEAYMNAKIEQLMASAYSNNNPDGNNNNTQS